jgi:N-acetylneuraminic acid mutarotase
MKHIRNSLVVTLLLCLGMDLSAQSPVWEEFPALPDSLGFAGMFAGVSNGKIFCMGGANFPDKKPWEGGEKIWSDRIFMYDGATWSQLQQSLPEQNGYGVSVSYDDRIILVGGNNYAGYKAQVLSCFWDGRKLVIEDLPKLPHPLSNMCGGLLNSLIVVTGGHSSASAEPSNSCLVLDLENLSQGWRTMQPIPGAGRLLPACGIYDGKYYLFSGENTVINNNGTKLRHILHDAYRLEIFRTPSSLEGKWQKLAVMPKGVSAGPSPLPVIPGKGFLFWGGVDSVTGLWKDPVTHPGISSQIISYDPAADAWGLINSVPHVEARVTSPVVKWRDQWIYISGEIRPGVRTNKNISVR